MAMVTGIEEARGQVEIRVDGRAALCIRKAHFERCPVAVGDEIDLDAYTGRIAATQFPDAYEAALTSLDTSERTAQEIRRSLRKKGYVEPVIDAVVERLRENRLIDDARYARRLAETQSGKPVGRYAVRRRLRAKGISEEDAEDALEAFDDEQQRGACIEAARGLLRRYAELPPREGKARLSQALARRGFPWSAIESALEEFFD